MHGGDIGEACTWRWGKNGSGRLSGCLLQGVWCSCPPLLSYNAFTISFTLMLLQYGSLVGKCSRMRGQLTSRLYSICHQSGFPRVSDWLSRLLYTYMFSCFTRYVYLCNYREVCLWQCAYPYVTEFIYVNARCFKFVYTCKHVCVQCVLWIWMCNLDA